MTGFPYKQVVKFRNRTLAYLLLPDLIYTLAKNYNNAHVLIEVQSTGQQVADMLYNDLEYENIIHVMNKGKAGQVVSSGYIKNVQRGVKASKATKKNGCLNLKSLIETDKLIINDHETIKELTTFVTDDQTYNAEPGCHDDLVVTLILFAWLVAQKYFRESGPNDVHRETVDNVKKEFEDDFTPFGVVFNMLDNQDDYYLTGDGTVWELVG